MKTITLDQVMEKNPCSEYPREEIAKWFPGKRPGLRKLFDVALENGVSHYDLVYHFIKYLDRKRFVFFACDCAERALKRVECKDKRSWEAIRISRLYVQGKASKDDMAAADAVADAAADAVAAAIAAERKWQLDRLLEYLEEV